MTIAEKFDFESHHFETVLGSQAVLVLSFCQIQNWRERDKPLPDFASFTRSVKGICSKQLSTSLTVIFRVWRMLGSKE